MHLLTQWLGLCLENSSLCMKSKLLTCFRPVCMYKCMYVCVYVYASYVLPICMDVCKYACMHVCVYASYVLPVCMDGWMCVCMCEYLHSPHIPSRISNMSHNRSPLTHTQIKTHTYIHTSTHTYIYPSSSYPKQNIEYLSQSQPTHSSAR
jgi:hypothetical protein